MAPRIDSPLQSSRVSRRTVLKSAAVGLTAGASLTGYNPKLVVAQDQPVKGGDFKTGATAEAVNLHPFLNTDTASFGYIDLLLWQPLLRYNGDSLELEPYAADSYKESDDHKTLTFTLKSGLTWSDGKPLTANDYAWTYQQAAIPENNWPRLGTYSPYLSKVEATDDATLTVTLKDPIATSLQKTNAALAYVLPQHVWEKLDWQDPEKNPEIMKPSVTCGPYTLQEWKKDQSATFAANDAFFLGRPNFDTYTVQVFGTSNVAAQALTEGQLHEFSPDNEGWPDMTENADLNALQWDTPEAGVMYFGFNTRLDIFKDKAVRQALNYAIDKELITEQLTYGLGKRAIGMYLPDSWAFNPDAEPFTADLDKAKQMLDDAGWKEGSDGVRAKGNQRLEFSFIYGPNNDAIREQIATVSQEAWGELGCKVEVSGMEWGAYLQRTKEGPYDWGVFLNMYIGSIDPDMIWFKKEADPTYNRVDFHNPEVEELYEQGLKEFDEAKRADMYKKVMGILTEESPWIWVYYEQGHTAMLKSVKGVTIDKLGLNDNWEWWLQS